MKSQTARHRYLRPVATLSAAALLALSAVACSSNTVPAEQEASTSSTSATTVLDTATEDGSETTTVTSTAQAAASRGDCSVEAIRHDAAMPQVFDVFFCDGNFALAGQPHTDWSGYYHFSNGHWNHLEPDGMSDPRRGSGGPCFNASTLNDLGVPASVRKSIIVCDQSVATPEEEAAHSVPGHQGFLDSQGRIWTVGLGEASEDVSTPSCDGRYILIEDSIIAKGSMDTTQTDIAKKVLMVGYVGPNGPVDRKFTYPGQCSSLRKQVDGHDIYPIYYDFGTDKQAMCAAKAKVGGNGRTLNNNGDFTDPCL